MVALVQNIQAIYLESCITIKLFHSFLKYCDIISEGTFYTFFSGCPGAKHKSDLSEKM
jgi:hypothetical protein